VGVHFEGIVAVTGFFHMLQILVVLAALVGAVLGFYAWFFEGTGVTGTGGALLAFAGALAVWAGAMLLVFAKRGWARGLLLLLVGLGAALTALAAWFLMQDAFTIAMAVAFVALLAVAVFPRTQGRVRA
jgi:quinoprotein glucose dehydrogenase